LLPHEPSLFERSILVHGIRCVVVFAYIDDTKGGANDDLTAVAAYVFDDAGLAEFKRLYQAKVEPLIPPDKHGRKIFRASACYAQDEPFLIERPIVECILTSMAESIRQSVSVGVVAGIERSEYDIGLQGRYVDINVGGKRVESLGPWVGAKFTLCLMRCIQGINDWMNREKRNGPISYAIEAGPNVREQEQATALLARVADRRELVERYRLGGYGFWPKSPDMPWLFAADYFAWEWQRYDRIANKSASGEWRQTILPLIEDKPHFASYLTETSVNTQALVNAFYGVRLPDDLL
jgi:hypothetical protein